MDLKKTILYIDDEPINLQIFYLHFRKKYNVITTESALEALEILKANPTISFVISDVRMPYMSGIEFVHLAKNDFPDVKFYILTGLDPTEDILNAMNDGIILHFFTKPFNKKEIEEKLEEEG